MTGQKSSKDNQGCAFGKITRERVDNFIKMFEDFKKNDFKHLADKLNTLASNMSARPSWAVSTIIWILSSALVGLLVRMAILGSSGG